MKNKIRQHLLLVLLIAVTLMQAGCTKEDTSECNLALLLNVKAYVDTEVVGEEIVRDITLYIFDENLLFLEQINCNVNDMVSLNHPTVTHFTIAAVGNGKQGGQSLPTFSVGDHITTGLISIKQTRASYLVYATPDDLFIGMMERVPNTRKRNNEAIVLPISRIMASVNVTIRGLREYYGAADDDYSVVIRKTYSAFDLYVRSSGTEISHQPAGSFNAQGVYFVPDFNILPLANNGVMVVEIYRGDVLITTVFNDDNGVPIAPKAGQLLNILVDFTVSVTVSIVTTPWGEAHLWKTWN